MNHRPGIICRSLKDAAHVLDAIKDPQHGYFDTNDFFTAIPKAFVSKEPYSTFVAKGPTLTTDKPLRGIRIGIVREDMVKHTPNDAAISDRVDSEIKTILRDKLGAEIVESFDPQYPDDRDVPNTTYTFQDAFAEVFPVMAPEYLVQQTRGVPEFAVPGFDVATQDYLIKLSLRKAPLSEKLNMRRILFGIDDRDRTSFMMAKYLYARGDAKIPDWASYAAKAKWRSEAQAAGAKNAAVAAGPLQPPAGIDRIKMQSVSRHAVLKVMHEYAIDVFVHPNAGVPQWKIGIDREPTVNNRAAAGPSITDLLGVPEVTVPAGFGDIVYDPQYVLSEDKKSYVLTTGKTRSVMPNPMPFSINFWAGPGDDPVVLEVASTYEAATHHRVPPPGFGPVPGTLRSAGERVSWQAGQKEAKSVGSSN